MHAHYDHTDNDRALNDITLAAKEPCIRWGSRSPDWKGNLEGGRGGR